jgi:hypothetical protein
VEESVVIKIAITDAAYEAIRDTLPVASVGFEPEPDAKGDRSIWLERRALDKLSALRGPGDSYSDVILRIAGREGGSR